MYFILQTGQANLDRLTQSNFYE